MKLSDIHRADIDKCAFLMKVLQAGKFEVEGEAVKNMHDTFEWVQGLANKMAHAWNSENQPKDEPDGPKNVQVTNPPASI